MSTLIWQKSSYSQEASSCVYLAAAPSGQVLLRESDTPGAVLSAPRTRLRPLISHIKAGTLIRLSSEG
ncbi:DUF397 domain-containing protein [Streptomyces roseifaciens]|uniref:DUF397 domain-containing protein n=1 Tax=Streptomyces roseifaciens TaxID=1488406 RepID=UPI0009A02AF3|nr:DUF397 domain-containing protein [Streptomyces roseifaciens]